jgi:peroxiredoxin
MKNSSSFGKAALLGIALLLISPAQGAPLIGTPAPDFIATDSNGVSRRLSDLQGATVILEWTNHDCPFVGKHYGTGNMQALQKEATQQGVVWLSVISSAPGKQGHVTPEQANALTRERDAAPTAVLMDPDGKIGRLYKARTTPHMFIIDPQGTLMYMGAIDDKPSANWDDVKTANNHVKTALSAMANNQPIDPSVTRPYGCSVKY